MTKLTPLGAGVEGFGVRLLDEGQFQLFDR